MYLFIIKPVANIQPSPLGLSPEKNRFNVVVTMHREDKTTPLYKIVSFNYDIEAKNHRSLVVRNLLPEYATIRTKADFYTIVIMEIYI